MGRQLSGFFFLPNSIHVRERGNCCLEKADAKFANEIKILINSCNMYLKSFIFITYLTNRCFPWCKNTLLFFSLHTSTNCFSVIYCTIGYLPIELMQSLIWRNRSSVNLFKLMKNILSIRLHLHSRSQILWISKVREKR